MPSAREKAEQAIEALDAYLTAKRRFEETPARTIADEDPDGLALFKTALKGMQKARGALLDAVEPLYAIVPGSESEEAAE